MRMQKKIISGILVHAFVHENDEYLGSIVSNSV